VLLDVAPGLKMESLRRAIEDLVRAHCVNIAILDRMPPAERTVQLPVLSDCCGQVRVFDGENMVVLVDKQDTLEVVTKVGPGGTILVSSVAGTREYVWFPEHPGDKGPDFSWKGPHPAYGVWSTTDLETFLSRPEVASRTPYIGLEISWGDNVADVVRCLAALRVAAGARVEPILRLD
jgi:hypothetical protein